MSIAVTYANGEYRVHAANCADVKRTPGARDAMTYDDGTTIAQIAATEFADFIYEDPDYYTPARTTTDFLHSATILPCAKSRLGSETEK